MGSIYGSHLLVIIVVRFILIIIGSIYLYHLWVIFIGVINSYHLLVIFIGSIDFVLYIGYIYWMYL